jgi:OmpA-OmpF porin, OOP family
MKKNVINIALAAVFALVSSQSVAEEAYSGSWYALPGISYMNADSDLDADNGYGASLRFGKKISDHWDVQAGGSYARANEDLGQGGSGKYKQTLIGVDALYMMSRDKLRPFLLVGVGAARNNVDYKLAGSSVGGSQTSWMANAGVGVQYAINDQFGIQADVRHVLSEADTVNRNDKVVGNTYLNVGAIFNFGAPAQVAVAEPVLPSQAAPIAPVEKAPEPVVPAAVCKPTFETITVSAEKLFGFDKYDLKYDGKVELDAAAQKLIENTDVDLVLVTGHTDRIGSDAYNQKLSERRANTVKEYLISQGVDASRLKSVGKGESEPVAACKDRRLKGDKLIECLQPNRRVVISAEKQRENACK